MEAHLKPIVLAVKPEEQMGYIREALEDLGSKDSSVFGVLAKVFRGEPAEVGEREKCLRSALRSLQAVPSDQRLQAIKGLLSQAGLSENPQAPLIASRFEDLFKIWKGCGIPTDRAIADFVPQFCAKNLLAAPMVMPAEASGEEFDIRIAFTLGFHQPGGSHEQISLAASSEDVQRLIKVLQDAVNETEAFGSKHLL